MKIESLAPQHVPEISALEAPGVKKALQMNCTTRYLFGWLLLKKDMFWAISAPKPFAESQI